MASEVDFMKSLETATKLSGGKVLISIIGGEEIVMSENFACPYCNYSLNELEPRMFSFNSPYGACDHCKGLGFKLRMDEDLIIPDKDKSLNQGAILPFKNMEDTNIYIQKIRNCL